MPQGMDRATYFARLGEDVEPGGRAPAPEPLRLVQRFVNTANHELGPSWDRLGSVEKAAAWLTARGLLASGERISERDRARLVELREALRALVATGGTDADARARVDAATRHVPVRVRFEGPEPTLVSDGDGVDATIGTLAAVSYRETITGRWSRLKPCRQCGWLFYDRSKNRSAGWCSMAVCGNRAKNRAYRGRRTAATAPERA